MLASFCPPPHNSFTSKDLMTSMVTNWGPERTPPCVFLSHASLAMLHVTARCIVPHGGSLKACPHTQHEPRCSRSHDAISQNRAEAECRLDTPHIVFSPVPLRHLFLTHGHAFPSHPHDGHRVNIVLLKHDGKI